MHVVAAGALPLICSQDGMSEAVGAVLYIPFDFLDLSITRILSMTLSFLFHFIAIYLIKMALYQCVTLRWSDKWDLNTLKCILRPLVGSRSEASWCAAVARLDT